MNTNTSLWQQELLRACTAQDVVDTVQDYLVLWKPDELAQLPEPCHPGRFASPADVIEYAAALQRHEGDGARRSFARETLASFLAVAARRLVELQARPEAVNEPLHEAAGV